MKACKDCHAEKDESEFPTYKNKLPSGALTEGVRNRCKQCYNENKKRTYLLLSCPSCDTPVRVRKDTAQKTSGLCQSCAQVSRIKTLGHPMATRRGDTLSSHPSYLRWLGMKSRCEGRSPIWKARYLDRGIAVCEQWADPWAFVDWAEANGFQDQLSIDRIDNDLGYYPENCRWVDARAQARNTSSNREVVTEHGATFGTLAEAAEYFETSPDRIYKALNKGWKCFGTKIWYAESSD